MNAQNINAPATTRTPSRRVGAVLLAVALLMLAAWVFRYETLATPSGDSSTWLYERDRWTGKVYAVRHDGRQQVTE